MVDTVIDYGYSGAPVMNALGAVVGMACASTSEGASWILKSDFIKDAIGDVLQIDYLELF